MGERTALINQLRAVLLKRGIVMPQGRCKLERHVDALLAEEEIRFSPRARLLIEDLRVEWRELDRRISAFDDKFAAQARTDETAPLLTSIPGIGPLNATALTAAIGNAQTFGRGRDLAAWLGLVPKQVTTGGKPKLLGSASAAMDICARCSFTVRVPPCQRCPMVRRQWARGCVACSRGRV